MAASKPESGMRHKCRRQIRPAAHCSSIEMPSPRVTIVYGYKRCSINGNRVKDGLEPPDQDADPGYPGWHTLRECAGRVDCGTRTSSGRLLVCWSCAHPPSCTDARWRSKRPTHCSRGAAGVRQYEALNEHLHPMTVRGSYDDACSHHRGVSSCVLEKDERRTEPIRWDAHIY